MAGAYTGDVVGWHDRARDHFDGYAASQVTDVEPVIPHPAQDSALNLARSLKKWGTPMYSNGYICRYPNRKNIMHHYDMNLCYIDELLWHFNWTGDMDYVRRMWPVLKLLWLGRNGISTPTTTASMMPIAVSGPAMLSNTTAAG